MSKKQLLGSAIFLILLAGILTIMSPEKKILNAAEFMSSYKTQEGILIDVRTPEEFYDGHIEGAINLNVEDPFFASNLKKMDPDSDYFIYCRSGSRSKIARELMKKNGFLSVFELKGGISNNTHLLE